MEKYIREGGNSSANIKSLSFTPKLLEPQKTSNEPLNFESELTRRRNNNKNIISPEQMFFQYILLIKNFYNDKSEGSLISKDTNKDLQIKLLTLENEKSMILNKNEVSLDSPTKKLYETNKILQQNDEKLKFFSEENRNLKSKMRLLEAENNELSLSLASIKEKYESLRDIDSPIKEVSQIKKVLKQNDERIIQLENEKTRMRAQIYSYEQDIEKNQQNQLVLHENSILKQEVKEIKEKYEI